MKDDNGLRELERTLQREFSADEGSFLLQIRCDLFWDRAAFSRLVDAMYRSVAALDPEMPIERWLAQGFWDTEEMVRRLTGQPDFPRPDPPEYYERALRRLRDLSYFLFCGESPYEGDSGFEDL